MTMGIITEDKKQNKDSDCEQTAFFVTSNKYQQGHMHVDSDEVEQKTKDLLICAGDELFM